MNGLLDFFNYNNSGLKEFADNGLSGLRNTMANTPKMYDPHANAQALMGGQAMQYNQQPQSLIAEQVNTPNTQASFTPQAPTEQQTQQMTYQGTPQAGVNYPNFDPSAINPYLDGDQTTYASNGYEDTSYNNRLNSAPVNSMLMGNAQTPQGVVGVDPNAPVYNTQTDERDYSKEAQVDVGQPVVTSTPFQWPWEAFGNQQTMQEQLTAQEIARQKLIERGLISPK